MSMKMYKRALVLLASATALTATMPLCARTLEDIMSDTSAVVKVQKDTVVTTPPVIHSVTTKEIDGKTYLLVYATDNHRVDHITVDGTRYSTTYNGDFKAEITKSQQYTIIAYDNEGNPSSAYYYTAKISAKPTLSLSKSTSGSNTYLKIKADDEGGIKKVTVNGDKIDFSSSGGTKDIKITKSGKYTVVVTDTDNNEVEDSITINLGDDEPSLTVDKKYVNGKWYVVIDVKPNDNNRISSLKVNNRTVSVDRKGGKVEYEVNATDTYKVVVVDSEGLEATKSIYININENNNPPTVRLSVNTVGVTQFLVIQVSDNGSISKLTVNGSPVSISSNGGVINYPVTVSGTYTVVATDNDGNETTQALYVAAMPTTSVPTSNPAGGTHTIIFKLNSPSYTVDGVTYSMDSTVMAKNNRTYIPFRFVSSALGVPDGNIKWDNNTKTVIIQDGSNVIKVPLNKKTMTVNGQTITMDAPAIESKGRIMVPISQVAKAFTSRNVKLDWQSATKQVVITRR